METIFSQENTGEPPGSCTHQYFNPNKRIKSIHSAGGFKSGPLTRMFRKKFYPGVSDPEWNDWKWQIRNRIKTPIELKRFLNLTSEEEQFFSETQGNVLSITPYYMSLVVDTPLRSTVIPVAAERLMSNEESDDPLNEDKQSPVPGIVHRYPDRVLFLTTNFCPVYCRYCTRSRITTKTDRYPINRWKGALEYIEKHTEIRDVLISGGDPLTLSDERLDYLLSRLRRISHIEIIRIGSKIPVVMPQRITPGLTRVLKRYHPVWMSLHFIHPAELTPETNQACNRLANAGIPLGSQTVLLRGVNDRIDTMRKLCTGLMRNRVRPYYIYQCDLISGSKHLRTSVNQGVEIIEGLRGHISGYAVPQYIIDAPGGGGKIPINPQYSQEVNDLVRLKNFKGQTFYYPKGV